MSAAPRVAQARAVAGLVLAMLSLWLAAPDADWRAVPWDLAAAPAYFYAALAELAVGLVLAAWAIGRLPGDPSRLLFAALAVALLAFLALEWLYWRLTDWEYRLYARAWDGVRAAPLAALIAALPLLRLPLANAWTRRMHIRQSRWVIGGGALAAFALLLLHRAGVGAYGMIETMSFALLATTFLTGAAVSLSGVFGKPRLPD